MDDFELCCIYIEALLIHLPLFLENLDKSGNSKMVTEIQGRCKKSGKNQGIYAVRETFS